jgi:TldD protein
LNRFQYGSPLVNITADATLKRGLGSFGYDDEGVPAQKIDLIKEGQLVGYLSSRETARIIDRKSSGAMRAESWNRLPLVRMTNINLLPGEKSWEELIGEIKEGIFMDTIKSWSIDDLRVNFQFGTELAREIKNGKLGRLFKNPTYTGQTSSFWYSCDGICHQDEWKIWGLPNCGKGEPVQTMGVGHGTAPARFRNVQVGVLK